MQTEVECHKVNNSEIIPEPLMVHSDSGEGEQGGVPKSRSISTIDSLHSVNEFRCTHSVVLDL